MYDGHDSRPEQGPLRRRRFLPVGMAATGMAALSGKGLIAFGQAPAAGAGSKYATLDTTEVLVVGGGPAGIGAALGAAPASSHLYGSNTEVTAKSQGRVRSE